MNAEEVSQYMIDQDQAWVSVKEQQIVMELAKKKFSKPAVKEEFDYSGLESKKFNMLKKNEMLNRGNNLKGAGGEWDNELGEAGNAAGIEQEFDKLGINNAQMTGNYAPKLRAQSLQKCDKCSAKHMVDCFSVRNLCELGWIEMKCLDECSS